jgi:hypothetical protein
MLDALIPHSRMTLYALHNINLIGGLVYRQDEHPLVCNLLVGLAAVSVQFPKHEVQLVSALPFLLNVLPSNGFALPPGRHFTYTENMKKPVPVDKKTIGRPKRKGGVDPLVSARLPWKLIDQIDEWGASAHVVRSEAVRRLVELGLTVRATKPQASHARAERAKELAAEAIDKMGDPAAPPEEHAQRRRRLTKGPEEFSDLRVDRPKAKTK